MPRFRRKPTIVVAEQYDPNAPLPEWCERLGRDIVVCTLDGYIPVAPGDWVVTTQAGSHHVVHPTVFKLMYEADDEL